MKKTLQLVLSLTLISAVCAAVLAIVNAATKERIANLATLKANAAARAVLPAAVKAIDSRKIPGDAPGDAEITVFIGYADDAKTQIAGYAVPGLSKKGYGGAIQLMVGLNPDRTVVTYQVLAAGASRTSPPPTSRSRKTAARSRPSPPPPSPPAPSATRLPTPPSASTAWKARP